MEKICPQCGQTFEPDYKKSKAIFCSDTCRIKHHRKAKMATEGTKAAQKPTKKAPLPQLVMPIVEVLEGISLEQFKHFMITYPDQVAIKALCREMLGLEPPMVSIPPLQATLPSRTILNPNADINKQMVEPNPGTIAYYIRNGKWGDGRDVPT